MDRYRGARRSPPPRDRPLRERDDHPNVEYFGEGESYRPGGPTGDGPYRPPNRDRYVADSWSSERRDGRRDDRREDIDSYIPTTSSRALRPRSRSPAGYRRRSRTPPPNRGREDLFASRTRSPPPRYSPHREDRPRSPRRRSRSPYGVRAARSPVDHKRQRDYSPPDYSQRSPKRERLASPGRGRYDRPRSPPRRPYSPPRDAGRGSYRARSRTPPRRDDRRSAYPDDTWRRRSPSPRASGPGSNNTSRRSSPPVHPDRASLAGSLPRSPVYPSRNQHDARADSMAATSYRAKSPRHDATPSQDYPERGGAGSPLRDDSRPNGESSQPPSRPSSYRNGNNYDRPPPSGPSRGYNQAGQATPGPGPTSSPLSISAHNRGTGPSMLSAPVRPRGAPPGRFDGAPRDFTSPPIRGRGSLTYRGPSVRSASYHQPDGPPSGPRGGGFGRGDYGAGQGEYAGGRGDYGGGRGDYGSFRGGFGRGGDGPFPFRGNNSSSTTYPRTQRFNTTQQHLTTTEKIVPGGKLLPSGLPPEQEKRIKILEAEAEKIRSEIAEKQKTKREAVNEWEVRERESEREGLRSELAENHLQQLREGDDGMGAAF